MTNDTQHYDATERKPLPFGSRLKSAREALGLECKDVAAQLRLNEKIIAMMEKDKYPSDLPITFIRGYIRSYGKFLQIPESEIKQGIEPIQPKPVPQEAIISTIKELPTITSGNYFVQFFTYLIVFTMLGLVGMWWYSHTTPPTANPQTTLPDSIATAAPLAPESQANNLNQQAQAVPASAGNVLPITENKVTPQAAPVVNNANAAHTDLPANAIEKSSGQSKAQKAAANADDDDDDDDVPAYKRNENIETNNSDSAD